MRSRDPAGRVLALPNQTPGILARTGLSRAQVNRAAWAIAPDGRRYAAAAAVNRTLVELGGAWALLARLYDVPGLHWCQDRIYEWAAHNRGRFARWGVIPACDRPGATCTDD